LAKIPFKIVVILYGNVHIARIFY